MAEEFEARFTIGTNEAITALARLRNEAEDLGPAYRKVATALDQVEGKLAKMVGAERTAARETKAAADAQRAAVAAEEKRIAGLSRTRYALYDVSNAAAVTGAALAAGFILPAKAAIDFERAFANVERTTGVTGAAAQRLKQDFIELSQTIPVSFDDLTAIGTLAGQLGIAANAVDNFSSVAARFSATTDLTVESSATALGRLAQLLPDVGGKYENLASSVLRVGVNSVATESAIVNTSTQIAGIANSAGLSADEVIGLSGALASVGTQPELSRGLVTRLFTNIQVAVASGGSALEDFGRISGQTGAEFKQAWADTPGQALLGILDGIKAQGSGATSALQALGIASVRDIPALQRLATNSDVLRSALDDANVGFTTGADLASQYGVISETTAAKLQILGNSFQAFLAAVGESTTGLAPLIDGINSLLRGLTDIASNPVGSTIAALALGFTALAAVIALTVAAGTRLVATSYAMEAALLGTGVSANVAAGAMKAFKIALIGTGIGAVVVLLGTLAAGLFEAGGAFDATGDKAQAFFGDLSALDEAVKLDTAAYLDGTGDAFQTLTVKTQANSDATGKNAETKRLFQDAESGVAGAMGGSTEAIDKQTIALGANTEAVLRKMLAENEALAALANNDAQLSALEGIGFDPEEFISALKQGEDAFNTYITNLQNKADELTLIDPSKTADLTNGLDAIANGGDAFIDYSNAAEEGINANNYFGNSVEAVAQTTEALSDQLQQQVDDIFAAVNASNALADATESLGEAFVNEGANAAFSGQALQAVIAQVISSAGSSDQAAGQLQGLFNSIVQGGYASASQLQLLQQSILAISGGKAVKAVPYDFSPFITGANKASVAAAKTGSAAGGAAKKIETLVDYARDLGSVFDRAFELRFGNTQAFDKITAGFNSIQKANEEASQAIIDYQDDIRELQASISVLTADRRIQEYFLSVAQAYGDTLRAGKIGAALEEIDADLASTRTDLAKKNKQLTDTQGKLSRSTVGNTQAAIDNREELLGLVGSYQDYVKQLASSGLSQSDLQRRVQQLQQDFIRQATQLGYNEAEVQQYALSFNDLTTAINGVPRNITVSANTDPAKQALQEFLDKANSSSANVGIGGAGGYGAGQAAASDFKYGFEQQMKRTPIAINGFLLQGQQVYQVPGTGLQLFNQGGFVPGATPSNPAVDNVIGRLPGGGVVGLQGGEPIINNKARGYYGDAMFNAINQMKFPRQGFATGGFVPSSTSSTPSRGSSGSSGPTVVVIDAAQFDALVRSGNVNVSIGAKELANAVASTNQTYADLGTG